MNIVILSPHFPDFHYRYAYYLKALGAQVIGIADQSIHQLSEAVKISLSDYYPVADMHHYPDLLRTCGQITADYGKIDRIESLNEYWLETEAALRTDFNVFGYQRPQIDAIKKKSAMKAIFEAEGVPCAPGQVIADLDQALQYCEAIGYPVVLKPNIGVGANNTFKAEEPEDVRQIFETIGDTPYIIEAYISGQIFSYDGLTNREGEPVFTTSTVYSDGVMEIVNSDNHVHYYTLREIAEDLKNYGEKLLKAFDVRERFFHFEFFRRHTDQALVALEVNMRPPGGITVDMFNYANDIDLYRQWAQIVVHNQFTAEPTRAYHCAYIGRKFWKTYRQSHEAVLDYLQPLLLQHGQLQPLFRKAMGDYYYLIRSAHEADILEAAAFIQTLED